MPHRIEQLRATITELEAELESIDELDEETRVLLQEASQEINAALHPDDLEHQSLVDRYESAQQSFTAEHPALASLIGKIVDALGQLGI